MSQQYRQLRSPDVPAELDRLVLRQAQEAVKSRPAKSRKWMRWAAPLALAASTVLVVSIVIESGVHKETYLAVPASAPAEVATQASAEQSTAGSAAEKRALAAEAARDKAVSRDATDTSVVQVVPVEPAAMADMSIEVPPPAVELKEPSPVPEFLPTAPQSASPPLNATADAPAELARREELDANTQSSARAAEPIPAPARAPARPAAARPARSQASEDFGDLSEVTVTGTARREQKQTAGPRNTVTAPAATDWADDTDEQQDEPRNYSDPEQWLRDIRQLRKQHKREEADREWRRFRYVFPNYEVADNDPARGALR